MTVTKKGVGWSVGIPGLRYGRSPDGRRYFSQGIPGTGLYKITYLPRKGARAPAPTGLPRPNQPGPAPQHPLPQARPPVPPPIRPIAPRQPAQIVSPRQAPLAGKVSAPRAVIAAITRFFDRLF